MADRSNAAYGASKAALIGLTTNLAVELSPRLRVNLVSSGATRTALLRQYVKTSNEGLADTERERLAIADAARLRLGRVAEPAEGAAVCIHLALDATTGSSALPAAVAPDSGECPSTPGP